MTKIKGTQILEQTTDFSIFVVDENGNIQLPENIKFNEAKILTEYDINKLIVRKKVEKYQQKIMINIIFLKYL